MKTSGTQAFRRLAIFVAVMAVLMARQSGRGEDRLWLAATVNGKPVRLAFDTGTGPLVLFSKAAARLGLAVTNPPNDLTSVPGKVAMGLTELCEVRIGSNVARTSFRVVEIPRALPVGADGLVGWESVNDAVLRIDARQGLVSASTNIPANAAGWSQFRLLTNSGTLQFDISGRRNSGSNVLVDTGFSGGAKLPPPIVAFVESSAPQSATDTRSVGTVRAWAKSSRLRNPGRNNFPSVRSS